MVDDEALVNDWHVVAFSTDIPEGNVRSSTLLGEELVLWRCQGAIQAWEDLCIHRGARLSAGWIDSDQLVCGYHGWRYNGEGRCVRIPAHPRLTVPAEACVRTFRVQERYGFVWVRMGPPAADSPRHPTWDDAAFRKRHAGPYHFRASGFRAVENFLDTAHFPFVHSNLTGDPTQPDEIEEYEVEFGPEGLTTTEIQVHQNYADVRGQAGWIKAGYTFSVFRPLTAYISKHVGDGRYFCTFMTAQPVGDTESIVRLCVAFNFGFDVTENQFLAREDLIFGQDRTIVETQRPERLPLDWAAEFHMPADKLSVEYRKWLRQLGVKFGAL